MKRDKMTLEEADKRIEKAKNDIKMGEDPYEIVGVYLALEPEYIFDLI